MGSAVSNECVARDEESRHEAQRCSPAVSKAVRICLDSDMPLPAWLKDQALLAADRPASFCGVAEQPEQEKVRRLSDFLGDHMRSQDTQSDVTGWYRLAPAGGKRKTALIPTSPLGLLAKELVKATEMGTCDEARPEHAGSSALETAPAVAMAASQCHSEAGEEASLVEATSETASMPLVDAADEFAPPCTSRRRAATDGNLDDPIESDSEEDASPRRERASTECCMVHLLSASLARDMSDSEQAAPSSPEWDADWSTISAHLQPQRYRIGESRAVIAKLRSQRVQVARKKRHNLVVRLASQAEMIEGTQDSAPRHRPRSGSDFASESCQVGRTRARTMSGGFPTARRSQRVRPRANTNTGSVYDLDWAALAALEA